MVIDMTMEDDLWQRQTQLSDAGIVSHPLFISTTLQLQIYDMFSQGVG